MKRIFLFVLMGFLVVWAVSCSKGENTAQQPVQPQAKPQATEQVQASPQVPTPQPPQPNIKRERVRGIVKSIKASKNEMVMADDSGKKLSIRVDKDTMIRLHGIRRDEAGKRQGPEMRHAMPTIKDIKTGDNVRVDIEERNGKRLALRIDVMPERIRNH